MNVNLFRVREELEERERKTREAWQDSQAEMIKTVGGLQDQLSRTDESLAELRAGLTVVVDDIAVNNTEMRSQLVQEIQTNIQERISQVNILVQEYEIKSKDVGQMMKEDHRKEMASIEGQLNTIYQEYEKMEKSLEEYRSSYSNDWSELSKANKSNEENIAKTDEKMNAIMEQANSLMINDARQDETLGKLESRRVESFRSLFLTEQPYFYII